MAAYRKVEKYVELSPCNIFEPIAVATLGAFNASAHHLLNDLGSRISLNSDEATESSYLYQRISVIVKHFNAVYYMTVSQPDYRQ